MEVKVEESKEIVKLVCNALEEKKAEDVKVIDIRNLSVVADYFIVANGSNQNQLLAMQDEVDKVLYTHGIHAKQIEGNRSSTWILMVSLCICFPRKIDCSIIWKRFGRMAS